jgi:hypothetical protein
MKINNGMNLVKISSPGWIKEFDTEKELKAVLYSYICHMCRKGTSDGDYVEPPVNENSTLKEMLASPCGCEFDVEGNQ